jgi:hypothetical protein
MPQGWRTTTAQRGGRVLALLTRHRDRLLSSGEAEADDAAALSGIEWECDALNALIQAAAAACRVGEANLEGDSAADTLRTVREMAEAAVGLDAMAAAPWLLSCSSRAWLLWLRAASASPPTESFVVQRQRAFVDAVPVSQNG